MSSKHSLSKFTYVMGFLIFVAAIIAASCLILGNPFLASKTSKSDTICLEKECISIANTLLSNIDDTVNPCDDFYQFACGGYADANPIPEHKSEISAMTKIDDLVEFQLKKILEEPPDEKEADHFKKMKLYYKSCIDRETIDKRGLTPMKEIMASVGGWPVVEDKEPESDWQTVLYTLRDHSLDGDSLMNHYIETDYDNSTKRILAVTAPSYLLPQEIMTKGKTDKNVQAYLKYMISVAQLYGADKEIAKRDMEEVLDFEVSLAKTSKSQEEKSQNLTALNNVYTIEKLEEDFPKFPWMRYLNAFTPKNFTVTKDLNLMLQEPQYVNKLIEYLDNTPNRTIINYIIWNEVANTASLLNEEIRDIVQQLFNDVLGQKKRKERYRECINNVQQNLLPIISSLYVRKLFDSHSRKAATEMVNYLRKVFRKMLEETKWSDDDKSKGLEKIDALNQMIGYQDELMDDGKIADIYKTLEIVEDDYFKSTSLINNFNEIFLFGRLYLPINKTDWIDSANAALVKAYYYANANLIVFPAAFLQGSYFKVDRPTFYNFATIGSVIGHEMSHGFDEVGHQFDKNGDLKSWWSEQANRDFAEKKKCIIEQFDNYTIFDGQHLKGSATVGENLADFGGQKMAYRSYQEWVKANGAEANLPGLNYTINQLYWIAGASIWCNNEKEQNLKVKVNTNSHSPNPFRVNGPLSNFEMFSKDFNCPVGSNMNPTKKCQPW